jgi:hypothetical protein
MNVINCLHFGFHGWRVCGVNFGRLPWTCGPVLPTVLALPCSNDDWKTWRKRLTRTSGLDRSQLYLSDPENIGANKKQNFIATILFALIFGYKCREKFLNGMAARVSFCMPAWTTSPCMALQHTICWLVYLSVGHDVQLWHSHIASQCDPSQKQTSSITLSILAPRRGWR